MKRVGAISVDKNGVRHPSRAIDSHAYDAKRKIVHIEWRSGELWEYHDVSPELWTAYLTAPSKGEFANRVFKVLSGRRLQL